MLVCGGGRMGWEMVSDGSVCCCVGQTRANMTDTHTEAKVELLEGHRQMLEIDEIAHSITYLVNK